MIAQEVVYTGQVGAYTIVSAVVALIIPILVDVVTKRVASARWKAAALAGLSAVNGFLTEYVHSVDTHIDFHVDTALMTAVMSLVVATAAYVGAWKPLGVSGGGGAVQRALPGGVGKPADPPPMV